MTKHKKKLDIRHRHNARNPSRGSKANVKPTTRRKRNPSRGSKGARPTQEVMRAAKRKRAGKAKARQAFYK